MAADIFTAIYYSLTVCCAIAVVENMLVILVFTGTKKLRIKYYVFVFNLALSDLLLALAQLPLTWVASNILQALQAACFKVSILMILAEAVNRYIALTLMPPARYDALMTRGRLVGVCLILWCFSLAIGIVSFIIVPPEVLFFIGGLVIPVALYIIWLITAILYCLLFLKIRRYTPPLASSPGIDPCRDQADIRIRQTRRLLVTFVFILVAAFISWMPHGILNQVAYFNQSLFFDEHFVAYWWGSTLVYCLSTLVNPLIYWWRLDGFREGFYAMFCRCFIKADSREAKVDDANEQTVTESGL